LSEGFTHLDADGSARMVDVGSKRATTRLAIASGCLSMQASTLDAIVAGTLSKGEVFQVARVAGILAAKRTGELIPLCHPLGLDFIQVDFQRRDDTHLDIFAAARLTARTGVEMEALTAISVAGLTVYDMCKAVDRSMELSAIRLLFKSGGKTLYCNTSGRVLASGGVLSSESRIQLLREPPSNPPSGPWVVLGGVPTSMLPEDLWLIFDGGLRTLLVEGTELLPEESSSPLQLPCAGTRIVVRLGESYGA
jgi:cyclic pyranopterin phosphate synthase